MVSCSLERQARPLLTVHSGSVPAWSPHSVAGHPAFRREDFPGLTQLWGDQDLTLFSYSPPASFPHPLPSDTAGYSFMRSIFSVYIMTVSIYSLLRALVLFLFLMRKEARESKLQGGERKVFLTGSQSSTTTSQLARTTAPRLFRWGWELNPGFHVVSAAAWQ